VLLAEGLIERARKPGPTNFCPESIALSGIHVAPESLVLNKDAPDPAYSVAEFEGSTARVPTSRAFIPAVALVHNCPPSEVLNTPSFAVAT
jgi:hypothetical protein